MPILSKQEIEDTRKGNGGISWVEWLCDSHEELRKERDDLLIKCKKLLLDKATVRETKEPRE